MYIFHKFLIGRTVDPSFFCQFRYLKIQIAAIAFIRIFKQVFLSVLNFKRAFCKDNFQNISPFLSVFPSLFSPPDMRKQLLERTKIICKKRCLSGC